MSLVVDSGRRSGRQRVSQCVIYSEEGLLCKVLAVLWTLVIEFCRAGGGFLIECVIYSEEGLLRKVAAVFWTLVIKVWRAGRRFSHQIFQSGEGLPHKVLALKWIRMLWRRRVVCLCECSWVWTYADSAPHSSWNSSQQSTLVALHWQGPQGHSWVH